MSDIKKYIDMSDIKIRHNCYDKFDFVPIFKEIELEDSLQKIKRKRTNSTNVILARHTQHKYSTLMRHYKKWICIDKPSSYIIRDKRKSNTKHKALSNENEQKIISGHPSTLILLNQRG